MRAIIIGAGNAGSTLALKLRQEQHDVVLVDQDTEALRGVESQLDVLTVEGHGCNPRVLDQAELSKADLAVAVTSSDDVNILACHQAARAGIPYKVARIADPDYLQSYATFELASIGIDLAVNPRNECGKDVLNNIKLPGAHEVIRLLGGRVLAVGLRVREKSPLLGIDLREFPRPELLATIRFIAILRSGELIIPHGDTGFEIGDDVYVVGRPSEIPPFLDWVYPGRPRIEKVVIAGGTGIGIPLARLLEKERIPVELIEPDDVVANAIATRLDRVTVLHGNPLSAEILMECSLAPGVAFIAATGNDENNIIGCLLARKHGAGTTIAQVTDPEYVPIINGINSLDRAVSTHLSMINAILHYLRGRQVESASLLHLLPGELIEVNLTAKSRWTGKKVSQIKITRGAVIATVLRSNTVCPPTGDLTLFDGDRVVIFATPSAVKRLGKIFHT